MKDFIIKCGLFAGMIISALMLMIASPAILAFASWDDSSIIEHSPYTGEYQLIYLYDYGGPSYAVYYIQILNPVVELDSFQIKYNTGGATDYIIGVNYTGGSVNGIWASSLWTGQFKSCVYYSNDNSFSGFSSSGSPTFNSNVYPDRFVLIYSDLPVLSPDDTPIYTPPTPYIDSFNCFILNSGGDIEFDLSCTENSEPLLWGLSNNYLYYSSQEGYSAEFAITIGSTIYTVPISSYNYKQFNVYYNGNTVDGSYISYTDVEEKQALVFMSYRAMIANPFPLAPIYLYRNMEDLSSNNVIKLYQLLDYINDKFTTSYTMSDLLSNDIITYNVRKDGSTVYTHNLDFSNLNPSNVSTASPSDIDPTSTPDPDLYPFKFYNYDKVAVSSIDNFGLPDVSFVQAEIDTDGINLFTWLWNSIIATPFGVVCLCALTFLIVKVVIW